ncbi:lysylphosphatidylglycerol synthase domain-containing protein [Methylorubrum suomiense]
MGGRRQLRRGLAARRHADPGGHAGGVHRARGGPALAAAGRGRRHPGPLDRGGGGSRGRRGGGLLRAAAPGLDARPGAAALRPPAPRHRPVRARRRGAHRPLGPRCPRRRLGSRPPGPLAQATLLHAAGWLLGAAEIWIVLACMGIEASLTEVLVLESLSQAIKSAAFPVPSGLGVQEGGFVFVGALFGLDAGIAIALSLAKRVPDVVLGLPSLLVWQTLEARRAQVLAPPG